jgi:hypothetical protein
MPDEAPLAASPRLAAFSIGLRLAALPALAAPRAAASRPARPVEQVGWQQAIEFCCRLAAITGDAPLLLDGDEAAGWR